VRLGQVKVKPYKMWLQRKRKQTPLERNVTIRTKNLNTTKLRFYANRFRSSIGLFLRNKKSIRKIKDKKLTLKKVKIHKIS